MAGITQEWESERVGDWEIKEKRTVHHKKKEERKEDRVEKVIDRDEKRKEGNKKAEHARLNMCSPNPLCLPAGQNVKNPQLPTTLSLDRVLCLRPPTNISLDFK